MAPATFLPSPRPPRLDPRPWPAAPSSPRHPSHRHHQQQPLRQHGLLFQAALSSPSLLSPPLRWRTIDLRNEVGLLSRIYTRFSLCVSDRFHPARHSLSLRIFMLVRARQRTHQQGEDASKPSLPLAASPGPLGRGFLGLRSFFPPFSFYLPSLSPSTPSPPCFQRPPRSPGPDLDAGQDGAIFGWPPRDGAIGLLGTERSAGWGARGDIPHRGYARCHLFSSSSQPPACGRRCRANADGL